MTASTWESWAKAPSSALRLTNPASCGWHSPRRVIVFRSAVAFHSTRISTRLPTFTARRLQSLCSTLSSRPQHRRCPQARCSPHAHHCLVRDRSIRTSALKFGARVCIALRGVYLFTPRVRAPPVVHSHTPIRPTNNQQNALGMDTGDAKRDQEEFAKSSLSLLECRSPSGQDAPRKEMPTIVMEAAEEKFLHDLVEGNPDTAGGRIASWMFGTRCARSMIYYDDWPSIYRCLCPLLFGCAHRVSRVCADAPRASVIVIPTHLSLPPVTTTVSFSPTTPPPHPYRRHPRRPASFFSSSLSSFSHATSSSSSSSSCTVRYIDTRRCTVKYDKSPTVTSKEKTFVLDTRDCAGNRIFDESATVRA